MATIVYEKCNVCKELTEQSWSCDFDSDPLEPQFHKVCHSCGGFNYD